MQLQSISRSWKGASYYGVLAAIVAVLLNGCSSLGPTVRVYPEPLPRSSGSVGGGASPVWRSSTAVKLPDGWAPVSWEALPGWGQDSVEEAWSAFMRGCRALQRQPSWKTICSEGRELALHPVVIRRFIEERFLPYQYGSVSSSSGLMTGYYEPLFEGSRQKTSRFRYPLYAVPDDLIRLKPAAKTAGSRGRRDASGQVAPYYWTREDIERGKAQSSLAGKELVYLESPVEVFVAQVQGSVRIRLEDGRELRLGYADGNGHPYKSIGRFMIDQGWLPSGQASMPAIRTWLEKNPEKLPAVMAANPSYVFFKEMNTETGVGPLGSLGVPLTPMRSVAVDPNYVPLGALVYMASSTPDKQPLQRLVVAQDVGSAIQGAQRVDFFWGSGEAAGEQAGRSRHALNVWLLWPRS